MKRFTFFLAAMAMIFAANAASSMNISGVARNHSPIKKQCTLSKRAAATGEGIMAIKKAAKRAQGGTLISNPPKGTVYENMYVNSEAYGLGWGDIYYQKVDGGLGGVDVADDGFIYVQAPISQAYIWGLGTPWIKCEKQEADVVVMHLPQLYCIDGGDNYYVQRLVLSDDGSTFVVDPSTQDVKFTWKDNKLTQVDDCLVGLCDADGEWFYMGDYNIEYTINPDKPVAKAEGAAKSLYQMTYNDDAEDLTSVSKSMVNVFKTADQLFIDHMESGLPDAVIAASISADGKTISIPTKQYLGTDANYNSHVYVLAGNAKVASQGDYTYFDYDLAQQTDLAVDEAGNAAATYPASLIVNCGRNTLYIISDIVAPRFEAKEDKAMTPADPIFTAEDVKISNNFDLVKFVIPTKDVDGNDLNVNNLYYNVYYNDAPYVFKPNLFIGLTEDLTDIPYGFCDSYYDIYMSTSTSKATIYFYDKAWDKLGVQSIYRGGGEERRSNVVWVKKAPTAITDVDARTAKSISYFNISGQRIAQPTQGICIKRTQWTDGTVTTEKIAK